MCTLWGNIKCMCTCLETGKKSYKRLAFRPVSKTRTNKFIFFDKIRVKRLCLKTSGSQVQFDNHRK